MLDLEDILKRAAAMKAGSVLVSVGRPPVARVSGKLQPPFDSAPLTFHDTERIAESLMDDLQRNQLLQHGSIELPFEIGGVVGSVTVFYGMGSHNMVFYLSD